ncbi:MAG TPA: hypothetical protein VF808_05875 [Ktedonobacterales bacterium]
MAIYSRTGVTRALVVAMALGVPFAASACGRAPELAHTGSSASAPVIRVAGASARIPDSASSTAVSASCHPGEQLIGGGFSASDIFEFDALITASYPSDPHTWTAVAGHSAEFALTVEAYCLVAHPDLGVTIIHSSAGQPACPTREAALGSGFAEQPPTLGPNVTVTTYVLCATRLRDASVTVQTEYNPHSSSHSYAPGSVTLTCPPGRIAIGGDAGAGGNWLLASSSAGPPYSGWVMAFGGDSDQSPSATCASIN